MKLSQIGNALNGIEILRDGEFNTLGLAIVKDMKGLLTFVENEKYLNSLGDNVSCLVTTKEISNLVDIKYGVIVSETPRNTYFKLHNNLANNKNYTRNIYDTKIGEDTIIKDNTFIANKNVIIGKNVLIEENVIIRENVTIGDNSIIRAGCIIGGEGFEFKRTDGIIMNVVHCGGVIIGSGVELQYNTTVDKALYTWDNTIIGDYSKLDNFVHIEHAVKIGERCLIASRTSVGGRTVVGNDSWIGLGAIISNGLTLGEKSYISLGAVVTKSINNGEKVSGNFAINHDKYLDFIRNIR